MNEGAKLSPGDIVGTLNFNGNLDLTLAITPAGTAAPSFELGALASSEKVAFATGGLTIGTGVLGFDDFSFSALAGLEEGTYTLFDGNAAINGTLSANLSGTFGPGFTGTLGLANGGTDLVLVVVPEAGSAMLLLTGFSSLLGLTRFPPTITGVNGSLVLSRNDAVNSGRTRGHSERRPELREGRSRRIPA